MRDPRWRGPSLLGIVRLPSGTFIRAGIEYSAYTLERITPKEHNET